MRNIRLVVIVLSLLYSLSSKTGVFTLFSDEVKEEYPSVLYDFLERYLFELDSLQRKDGTLGNKLIDDNVSFLKGSPFTARNMTLDMPFTISRTESLYYEVAWSDTIGNELLHIVFPASFELILGMPKHQIEKTMRLQLQAMPGVFFPDTSFPYQDLEQMDDGYFVSEPKQFLGIEELNTCTYYNMVSNVDSKPIFDSSQNVYSAKNLLQGLIENCNNYKLYILQNLYDFKTDDFTLNLSQWLNYCRDIHATVYVAVEEEREDGLVMLLVVQSPDLGFQHALSLILPWNFVDKQDCILKGKLNAYIPIHNVNALYQEDLEEQKTKKKGQQWHVN